MRTRQSSDRAGSRVFLIAPCIALLAATAPHVGCRETVQVRYCFDEAKLLRYDLQVETSLLPDIAFTGRGEVIWRCLRQEPTGFDLEIMLRDLVVSRGQAPVQQGSSSPNHATIRFRMSDQGDMLIADQAVGDYGASPAKMVLEALLDAFPRLPVSPIGENDRWTAQSRVAATQLVKQDLNLALVRYESLVEEVPVLFGGVVLSLSSLFESDDQNEALGPRISGRGKGRIVLCSDDCTIKNFIHETRAVIVLPQAPAQGKTDARRLSYRMRLALNLIEEGEVTE